MTTKLYMSTFSVSKFYGTKNSYTYISSLLFANIVIISTKR